MMEQDAPLLNREPERLTPPQAIIISVLACLATTALTMPLLAYLDLANIVMLFLLTVLLIAVKLGRSAAVLASVLSVILFDVFFVPPRFSLAVSNIQYLVTFAVMLLTALITAHLAADLRKQAQEAKTRERRTQALYQLSRKLAGALSTSQVADIVQDFISSQLKAQSVILLPTALDGTLTAVMPVEAMLIEPHLAAIAMNSGQLVRSDEVSTMGYAPLYIPLPASLRICGVLAVRFPEDTFEPVPETTSLLEALASLVAVAIERLHYAAVAQATEVSMLTERLRSSILSALSHDLRTPLTALVGLAESLFLIKPKLPPAALETANALHEQASRMAGLVSNLLDMARLNAGQVTLRREWQPLEEVVGASIKLLGSALDKHQVKVDLARSLPLLAFDAVLIERVLCNLLENAAKYSPAATLINLTARQQAESVEISVIDQGPGFPAHAAEDIFKMFVRGNIDSGKPGSGLGLAICKAIVEAHGGQIRATSLPGGGGCVSFTLPKGQPPVIEDELP